MMKKELFKINQKIQIKIPGDQVFHNTIIQDLTNNVIYVSMPVSKERFFMPQKGERIEGRYNEGDALLYFDTSAFGVTMQERVPLLMLQKPSGLTRIQRRKFYRRPALLDLEFRKKEETAQEWVAAKTLDIGGGGIRFISSTKMTKGDELDIKVFINSAKERDENVLAVSGYVIRVELSPTADNFIHSVSFTDIRENQRDRIINYIFTLARKKIF